MLTFEKLTPDGLRRVEVFPGYFKEYFDGQFLRRGLIGDKNIFIEDLYGAEYHEAEG